MKKKENKSIGTTLESLLNEMGIAEETDVIAHKKVSSEDIKPSLKESIELADAEKGLKAVGKFFEDLARLIKKRTLKHENWPALERFRSIYTYINQETIDQARRENIHILIDLLKEGGLKKHTTRHIIDNLECFLWIQKIANNIKDEKSCLSAAQYKDYKVAVRALTPLIDASGDEDLIETHRRMMYEIYAYEVNRGEKVGNAFIELSVDDLEELEEGFEDDDDDYDIIEVEE